VGESPTLFDNMSFMHNTFLLEDDFSLLQIAFKRKSFDCEGVLIFIIWIYNKRFINLTYRLYISVCVNYEKNDISAFLLHCLYLPLIVRSVATEVRRLTGK
jgi:hypothetical protein